MHEPAHRQFSSRRERLEIHWLTGFLAQLELGLNESGWVQEVNLNQIEAGREICQELWPFIRELPGNIVAVKDKLPEGFEAASKFLHQLADDELHYQNLYLKQCELAGLDPARLQTSLEIPHAAERLINSMRQHCQKGTVVEGVQAVVAAELAATQFARLVLEAFEGYFERHTEKYGAERVEEGLKWLRLHAKTNTRHALWMRRMLDGVENLDGNMTGDSKNLPHAVEDVLESVFQLWRTPDKPRNMDIVVIKK